MNQLIDAWWSLPDGPEADKLEAQIRAEQDAQIEEVANDT